MSLVVSVAHAVFPPSFLPDDETSRFVRSDRAKASKTGSYESSKERTIEFVRTMAKPDKKSILHFYAIKNIPW